jgi:hypothetical protein
MRLTKFVDDLRVFVYRLRLPDATTIRVQHERENREAGWTDEVRDRMHREAAESPEAAEALAEIRAEREQRKLNEPRGVSAHPQRPGSV